MRDGRIGPEALATLFDPYRRGKDAGHNVTGLGLSDFKFWRGSLGVTFKF